MNWNIYENNYLYALTLSTLLFTFFMCFYVPYWLSKEYENPIYVRYGLPLRNNFPFECEIEVCPYEWTPCRNVNDEIIKNIECK